MFKSEQKFLPEGVFSVDSEMNHKKLQIFYENTSTITGRVVRINQKDEVMEIDVGNNIIATMSFNEATIYPIYSADETLSPNIYELGGKIIRAKVAYYDGKYLALSRKANMLKALEYFKYETSVSFSMVTGLSKLSAFIDIGGGIVGRTYARNACNTLFRDIKDVGINKRDIFPVKILEYLENTNQFELSRVDAFPDISTVLNRNDIVVCKIFDPVNDEGKIGYYALIMGKYCGIVDSPDVKLHYGDKIVATIRKITPKGPKLTFIKKT